MTNLSFCQNNPPIKLKKIELKRFKFYIEKKPDKAKEITEDERVEKEKHRREELRKQKEKRDRRKKRIAEGRDTSSEEDEESLDGNV